MAKPRRRRRTLRSEPLPRLSPSTQAKTAAKAATVSEGLKLVDDETYAQQARQTVDDLSTKAEKKIFTVKTAFDLIDPSNLLVVVANVFAYIILQTVFFWFIASNSVNYVLEDKAGLVHTFFSQRDSTERMMRAYLDNPLNTEYLPSIAARQKEERDAQNWELVKTYIMPVAVVLLVALVVIRGVMFFRRQPLTRIDMFLLFLVLGAFTTELYFFLTVSSQLTYIGDGEITWTLYSALKRVAERIVEVSPDSIPLPIPIPGVGPINPRDIPLPNLP